MDKLVGLPKNKHKHNIKAQMVLKTEKSGLEQF